MREGIIFFLLLLIGSCWSAWSGIGGDPQHSNAIISTPEAYPSVNPTPIFSTQIDWSLCRGMPLIAPFGDAVWYSTCGNGGFNFYLVNATDIASSNPTRSSQQIKLDTSSTFQPNDFKLEKNPLPELAASRKNGLIVLPFGCSVYFMYSNGQQKAFTLNLETCQSRGFTAAAAIDDSFDRVFAVSEQGSLLAFARDSIPSPMWNRTVAPSNALYIRSGKPSVPVVSPDGKFVCISWEPRHFNASDPAANFAGSISCFDTASGDSILYFEQTQSEGEQISPIITTPSISLNSSRIYVGTRHGILGFSLESNNTFSIPLFNSNSSLIARGLGTPLVLLERFNVSFALDEACHLHTFSLLNGSLIPPLPSFNNEIIAKYCPDHLLPHGDDRRHSAFALDVENLRLIVSTGDWILSLEIALQSNGFYMPQMTAVQWNVHVSSCRKSFPLAVSWQQAPGTPAAGVAFYSSCEAQSINIRDKMWRNYFFEALTFNPLSVTAAPMLPNRYPTSLIVKIALGVGFPVLFLTLGLLGAWMWKRAKRKRDQYMTISS